MKTRKTLIIVALGLLLMGTLCAGVLKWRGFRAASTPSAFETVAARSVRDFAIPGAERHKTNPDADDWIAIQQGREDFLARCASCHGVDAGDEPPSARTSIPAFPTCTSDATQNLSDGEIHYIIENGIQFTGMPAMASPHRESAAESWKLVAYIRSFRTPTREERAVEANTLASAHYTGSQACQKCHADIYERWKKTPMANVVRDPREHPDAIIPDLSTNNVAKFTMDQVAFVYGSNWKQRYFTKVGDDYYPLPAQWDIGNKTWRPYHVPDTRGGLVDGILSFRQYAAADRPNLRWLSFRQLRHPHQTGHRVECRLRTLPRSRQRTRCASHTRQHPESGADGRRGRERHLHPVPFPGAAAHQTDRGQSLRLAGRIPRRLHLADYWKLEDTPWARRRSLHFADGTAHKNRMQGNDFVQSVMYEHGVTCASCHDVHGTENYAQLRKPVDKICLDCHGPTSPNGPHTATSGATYPPQGRQPRQPVRGLPHAEDRDSGRAWLLRELAYVQVHLAGDDGQVQDSQPLHILPYGQVHDWATKK